MKTENKIVEYFTLPYNSRMTHTGVMICSLNKCRTLMRRDFLMKRSLRALLLAPCLALFTIGVMSTSAQADIDTDRVMRATVWVDVSWNGIVEVPYADNTTDRYSATVITYCTGFIVSATGHVATAGHCVRYDEGIRRALISKVIKEEKLAPANGQFDVTKLSWNVLHEETPTIRIGQPSIIKDAVFDNDGITAQLIGSQDFEAGDNALVQVANKQTADAVLQVADQTPKVRDRVTAVGFPGDTAVITDADRQSPTFKEGSISAQTVSKKGVPQLQLDAELISGMSGGPTLNNNGLVVGINSSGFDNRNQSYITDTTTLRTFLEQNGVKLTVATTATSAAATNAAPQREETQPVKTSGDNTLMIVLIVVVVLLLAAVGAVAFLFLRKQRAATQQAPPQAPTPPPSGPNNQGYSI
jgi:S1-C subfamily serine protease